MGGRGGGAAYRARVRVRVRIRVRGLTARSTSSWSIRKRWPRKRVFQAVRIIVKEPKKKTEAKRWQP